MPVLKESLFTSTFKGRRKSSVTNILRRQQHTLQLQQQCILEHQHHANAIIPPLSLKEQGQRGPGHQSLTRSSSSPLCKPGEQAATEWDEKEGQQAKTHERVREQRRGVKSSERVAVSACLLPLSSSASAESSHLPLTLGGQQQGLSSADKSDRKPSRETVSAATAAQEEAQNAQPRAQQHGLLAKGVRLLRNMGNQEAKQKKATASGGTAGDTYCEGNADDRDVDKKSKKSFSRSSKGESNAKKKAKSDSKSSVFSNLKIRKTKTKGLSNDDILEDERIFSQAGSDVKASQSADDMDLMSDYEGDLNQLAADGNQSGLDENGHKTSSGSDADLYSFHSAPADSDDLLSDIQQTIRQCAATEEILDMMVSHLSEGSGKAPNQGKQALDSGSGAKDVDLKKETQNENHDVNMSRDSSGPGSPSESGQSSSAPDTEQSSGSLFPKTNSTYSFPDTTTSYESAEESQDDLESPAPAQQGQSTCVPCIYLDAGAAGAGALCSHKSISSTDLSMEQGLEGEEVRKQNFLSLKRRKNSMSSNQLNTDSVSQPRRTSSSSSTVKLYPPVHPSYVKTTTRQLTSPIGSPLTSPNVPRKTEPTFLDSTGRTGLKKRKQRSSSIAGPLSASEWAADFDELGIKSGSRVKGQEQEMQERVFTTGTYWTLGSRRAHYVRQASNSSTPYLDVFSGESIHKARHCFMC